MNAVHIHRLAHALHARGIPDLPHVLYRLIFLLFNSSIPASTRIGEGSWLGYGGMGVVIHGDAVIGRNVFLAHQVTICGGCSDDRMPVLEDDVYVSPGARILGPITIGRGAFIAANAVVIADV